ncbi:MAG TPA: hypothetical protein PKO39_07510 [Bacilli bacterium]|nr:hypothetical protein [Bacilli bacterium]HPZ27967.1 hypothetical protein [Bacilli bacterium]HQC90339.1 hypothetical protein [Bacilli bacterium]
MKRTLFAIIIILFSFFLASCVGIGYEKICKENTAWSSPDKRLEFQMQGFQSSHGTGHININGETTEIAVILSPVHQKLVILVRGEEEITELMVFKISAYKQGWKTEEDRIKLTIITNNSADESYNDSFDLYRHDLEEEEIDAKYYSTVDWENPEYGIKLSYNEFSDFTKILDGKIEFGEHDLEIEFRFLENRQFEVHAGDDLVLAGTYQTDGLEMILNMTANEIYEVDTLTLSVVTS